MLFDLSGVFAGNAAVKMGKICQIAVAGVPMVLGNAYIAVNGVDLRGLIFMQTVTQERKSRICQAGNNSAAMIIFNIKFTDLFLIPGKVFVRQFSRSSITIGNLIFERRDCLA